MEIRVNVKHMGKRRKSVEERRYRIGGRPETVRELILAVVEAGVREYEEKVEAQGTGEMLRCLTEREIRDQAEAGKVSFGAVYGEGKVDLREAQENAIQCFEDGIYRIFLDDRPLEELDERLDNRTGEEETNPGDSREREETDGDDSREKTDMDGDGVMKGTFTFVRLTMLSGRMW